MRRIIDKMESLQEISECLDPFMRWDVLTGALDDVYDVTRCAAGMELLLKSSELLKRLVILTQYPNQVLSKDVVMTFMILTRDEAGTNAMLIISESRDSIEKYSLNLIEICIRAIMDKYSCSADPCSIVLSNMTSPLHLMDRVITLIEQSGHTWEAIVTAFTTKRYNITGAGLHNLGPVFSNLSRSPHIRRCLMDRDRCVIQRLLPFTECNDTLRRHGIIGTLKNCTFDTENHEWLLSPEVDLLSYLLLPLAGPEEFDDEDNDKLPINLQYLPETKTREPDPDIRLMLLEALNQLCATKATREILRGKNTYLILREFHKWEKDKSVLLACENVMDILIKTEEEIGLDNLKEVEVPSKYTNKFHEMDKDFINNTV